jgi:hypothetical protein
VSLISEEPARSHFRFECARAAKLGGAQFAVQAHLLFQFVTAKQISNATE